MLKIFKNTKKKIETKIVDYAHCDFINSEEDCCWKNDTDCRDCIKQYFEKKEKNNVIK